MPPKKPPYTNELRDGMKGYQTDWLEVDLKLSRQDQERLKAMQASLIWDLGRPGPWYSSPILNCEHSNVTTPKPAVVIYRRIRRLILDSMRFSAAAEAELKARRKRDANGRPKHRRAYRTSRKRSALKISPQRIGGDNLHGGSE